MIPKEIQITNEEFIHREQLKDFFKNETGINVLSQRILLSGVLSEIKNESDVIAHNLCVKELEEIGLLDEEGLNDLLKYLLNRVTKRPIDIGDR